MEAIKQYFPWVRYATSLLHVFSNFNMTHFHESSWAVISHGAVGFSMLKKLRLWWSLKKYSDRMLVKFHGSSLSTTAHSPQEKLDEGCLGFAIYNHVQSYVFFPGMWGKCPDWLQRVSDSLQPISTAAVLIGCRECGCTQATWVLQSQIFPNAIFETLWVTE